MNRNYWYALTVKTELPVGLNGHLQVFNDGDLLAFEKSLLWTSSVISKVAALSKLVI